MKNYKKAKRLALARYERAIAEAEENYRTMLKNIEYFREELNKIRREEKKAAKEKKENENMLS